MKLATFMGSQVPRYASVITATVVMTCTLIAVGAVTNDRVYRFGDDSLEDASANAEVGSGAGNVTPGGTIDSGNPGDPSGTFFDLLQTGDPIYVNLSAIGSGRTGLGIQFDGNNDYLAGVSLNRPDDLSTLVPSFPIDYSGITSRGLQMWVYPDATKVGVGAQTLVLDTQLMGGPQISADGTWTQANSSHTTDDFNGFGAVPGDVAVVGNTWHHVMHHAYNQNDPNSPRQIVPGGGTNHVSVLYVNGIAVSANGDNLPAGFDITSQAFSGQLVVGAEDDGNEGFKNHFQGVIDGLEMYVFGNNESGTPGDLTDGEDWGTFDLFADNEWIAQEITNTVPGGVLRPGDTNKDGAVNGDGTGPVGSDDVSAFIAGWRNEQILIGAHSTQSVGDWNTWNDGDFNHDGITDVADWLLLRANHPTPALLDLGTLLNAVPEPSSLALSVFMVAGLFYKSRRMRFSPRAIAACFALLSIGLIGQRADAAVNSGGFLLDTGGDLRASTLNVGATFDGSLFFDIDDPEPGSQFDSGTNGAGPFQDSQNPDISIRQRNTLPSYVTFGAGADATGVSGGWGYQQVMDDFDDPTIGFGGDVDRDFDDTQGFETGVLAAGSNSTTALIDLTVGTGAPSNILIGIFTDNLDSPAFVPTSIIVSNGAESTSLPTQSPNLDGDVYFATLTGVSENDVITISAFGATNFNTLGGILIGDATGFVSPLAPKPTLTIDRSTGSMLLENNTANSLDVVAYEILSNSGSLDPNTWESRADADSNWIEFTAPSDRDNLAEGKQPNLGGDTLANGGGQLSLGNGWIQNPTEDVTMRLGLADNSLMDVDVIFVGNDDSPLQVGDLNFINGVEADDWNMMKAFFGSDTTGLSTPEAYQAGDLNNDGTVNFLDVNAFAAAFDAANGVGAFAALASVPEPASVLLMACGLVGIGIGRKRIRK